MGCKGIGKKGTQRETNKLLQSRVVLQANPWTKMCTWSRSRETIHIYELEWWILATHVSMQKDTNKLRQYVPLSMKPFLCCGNSRLGPYFASSFLSTRVVLNKNNIQRIYLFAMYVKKKRKRLDGNEDWCREKRDNIERLTTFIWNLLIWNLHVNILHTLSSAVDRHLWPLGCLG